MTSVVDICNMALAHIRAGSIQSLDEQSVKAEYCSLFYETCRDQILEDAAWGFAQRIEPLSLLDSDFFSVFNWGFVYQYPSDCLKIHRLVLNYEQVTSGSSSVTDRVYGFNEYPQPDLDRPVPYQIFDIDGTTVIAANHSELKVKYTAKIVEPNKFSSSFKLALSRLLAAHIAVPIVGEGKGSSLAENSLRMYRSLINNAIANDMNQHHRDAPDSEFITVRS